MSAIDNRFKKEDTQKNNNGVASAPKHLKKESFFERVLIALHLRKK